jgi:Carbohydrate family 9 binding domain-like
MNGFLRRLIFILIASLYAASETPTIYSNWSNKDVPLNTDPTSQFWRDARAVEIDSDTHGHRDPKYQTKIRMRWTNQNLYFLFVCPYEELSLKPHPETKTETNQLWNWDVAEAFIGADFKNIKRYREFEISPQGEWIDLDIDLNNPHHEDGWIWNSGFEVLARIDRGAHLWYGAMRIPYSSIDTRPAAVGNVLRINLFRSQGPATNRHELAWQPPMSDSFHVPERFGLLKLVKNAQ